MQLKIISDGELVTTSRHGDFHKLQEWAKPSKLLYSARVELTDEWTDEQLVNGVAALLKSAKHLDWIMGLSGNSVNLMPWSIFWQSGMAGLRAALTGPIKLEANLITLNFPTPIKSNIACITAWRAAGLVEWATRAQLKLNSGRALTWATFESISRTCVGSLKSS
jgi:hypothetical protein